MSVKCKGKKGEGKYQEFEGSDEFESFSKQLESKLISMTAAEGRRMSPCIFLYALEGAATAQASAGRERLERDNDDAGSWFTN